MRRFDAGTQPFDSARGEGPSHEPAEPVVIGRVAEQHRLVHEPREPVGRGVLAVPGRLGLVDAHRLMTQYRVHARVARDDPRAEPRPVDGTRLSQPPVYRPRFGSHFRTGDDGEQLRVGEREMLQHERERSPHDSGQCE